MWGLSPVGFGVELEVAVMSLGLRLHGAMGHTELVVGLVSLRHSCVPTVKVLLAVGQSCRGVKE